MDINWMPASDEPDVLRKMVALVGELLDCLPDSRKWWVSDDTWEWCWEELSDGAQDKVAKVRRKALTLLAEVEKAQGGK